MKRTCNKCGDRSVKKNGSRTRRCLGKLQQYRCQQCGASWTQPVAAELSLFKEFRMRTPAATICHVVALFALGISMNGIERKTGVKGETVHRIIDRLVTCNHWRALRNLIVRKTGILETDLHNLDRRSLELEFTGEDLLRYQGYLCQRSKSDRVERLASKILSRQIFFGAGNT